MGSPESLSARLEALVAGAHSEVVLVAPFMKATVVGRLVDLVSPDANLTLVTRWRLEEILAGVSDLAVWDVVKRHPSSRLLLLDNLHAKVYLADDSCLIGSANLTETALAGSAEGNLELLTHAPRASPDVEQVLQRATNDSIPATEALHAAMSAALPEDCTLAASEMRRPWRPTYRHPADLLEAAEGRFPHTPDEQDHAHRQLRDLGLATVGRVPSRREVSAQLLAQPLVARLLLQLQKRGSMRFGEIRQWVGSQGSGTSTDTQTLVRWVVEFLGDWVEYTRPGFSEVLALRDSATGAHADPQDAASP